jgi:hypothetical protein
MNKFILSVSASVMLLACASTQDSAATSWGKPGVSFLDYWTDSAECALAAAATPAQGGSDIDPVASESNYAQAGRTASVTGASAGGGVPTPGAGGPNDLAPVSGGGAEVHTNMYDVASRVQYNAALAQRNADMARMAAGERCLTDRGYRKFALTPAQLDALDALPEGARARREYLHSLAADPEIQSSQGL